MPLGSVLARGPSNRVSAAIKTLDYSPTPSWFHLGQKQAWESEDYLILAIVAGWQSGKSCVGAPWLVREIQLRKDCDDFAAISPSYPLMTKKVLPELEKALKGLAKWRAGDKQFRSTKEGLKRLGRTKHFTIHLGHCQNPESLESATYGAVWWDEPGQCEEANYHVLRARLAVKAGRMLMTSRPYEFNWYKRLIWDQRYHPDTNPKSKIKVVNFRSQDNPEFKMDLEQVRKEMPEWLYAMRYEGIFTRPAGAIYDCFDPAIHYRRPWKMPLPEAEIVIGLDFGLVNMAAIWGVRWLDQEGNNCIHWVGTYHAGQRSTEEHVTAIMGQIKTSMKGLGISKWRIVRAVGGAASEDQWRIQFAGAGLAIEKPPYHLVEPAIQCVYRQLKKGHFTFEPGLGKLKTEFEEYAFETTDEGDVLDKIKEKAKYHRLDSLRYIGSAEFPLTPEEERASNVTRRSNAGTEK